MGEALALVELVQLSDVGRVRHHNEDRAFARGRLIAVADGMGGAKAGEVAAQMAVDAIAALPERASVDAVRDAVAEANRAIHGQASSDRDRAGMGTTFTGGLLRGAALNVLHVGDSRAYLWRDGRLIQITDDHSVVAELVRRGTLTEREAETHPHRNVITRALGAERTVQIDQISRSVRAGDVILLCSDGLSSYVSAAAIAGALADGDDLNAVARELVRLANDAGGVDNVTAVLVETTADPLAAAEQPEHGLVGSAAIEVPGEEPVSTARDRLLN
ncbi:MAG TPA: Stp1/IreP family PP2C-type Ser/Thr phosphatase, partial [Miltoncostaeaceae bacterium]|nr:Stp1/IreP family PP2C-type Ser/Thr phosphatase [Miltoncostaeaceae bacterium]